MTHQYMEEIKDFFSKYNEILSPQDFSTIFIEEFCDRYTEEEIDNGKIDKDLETAYNWYRNSIQEIG